MGLSEKEAKFARLVTEGHSQSEAYRAAFDSKGKSLTVRVEASRLMRKPAVTSRIAELRAQADQSAVLTMQRRREILRAIAENAGSSGSERIAAIREDAILAGERRTDGTQVNIGGELSLTMVLQSLRAPIEPRTVSSAAPAEVGPNTARAATGNERSASNEKGNGRRVVGPLGQELGAGSNSASGNGNGRRSAVIDE